MPFSHFDLQIKEQRGMGGGGDGQRRGASWSRDIGFPNKQLREEGVGAVGKAASEGSRGGCVQFLQE